MNVKKPMSHNTIYWIMLITTIVVATAFAVKNYFAGEIQAVTVIGSCLAVFVVILLVMKLKKVKDFTKELVLSLSLLVLVFLISLYSGKSYSDDFCIYLAIIGMTGLYLQPKFSLLQVIFSDILLVAMYFIHPEKAGDRGQYILCIAVFTLAGFLFFLTIRRGRAFIDISEEQTKEAEYLIESIRNMGTELEKDFSDSLQMIEGNTTELKKGSKSIAGGVNEMTKSCSEVHDTIIATAKQVTGLNDGVKEVEKSLNENNENILAVKEQIKNVGEIIGEADSVFNEMQVKMREISKVAEELNNIAFNITLLSLNASIEAARAGVAGSGFDVVATRMRELSSNSNDFSEQVSEVVKELSVQVNKTAGRFEESAAAMAESENKVNELESSFVQLNKQFDKLYENIEEQNRNVSQVDSIFNKLNGYVYDMENYTLQNQSAVDGIIDAMEIYKGNISNVIEQTKDI